MEGVASHVPNRPEESPVKGGLTAKTAAEREPVQLVFGLVVPDLQLTEPVALGWGRLVHAVPVRVATARRLGLEGWPIRAFCGSVVKDAVGGTDDPDDICCQRCLRALRVAGLL